MKLRRAVAWSVIGVLLAAIAALMLPVPSWRTGRQEVLPLSLLPGDHFTQPAQRIWIDTDAACGNGPRVAPDDCFALLLLAGDAGPTLVGVSTVFGNAPLSVTDRTARQLVAQLPTKGARPPLVHAGRAAALSAGDEDIAATDAEKALLESLERDARPLSIVALGPLTNIAAALRRRPDLHLRVERIVAVMGRRPGHWFHPSEGARRSAMLFGHGPVFSDLNFVSDRQAAAAILRMQVPLMLVPYDAARHIELAADDLARMRRSGDAARWVAESAHAWLEYWRNDIGRSGFHPFDVVAAAFALRPGLLQCARVPVRIGGDLRLWWPFRAAPAMLAGPEVADAPAEATIAGGRALYCPVVNEELRGWLSERLAAGS